MLRPRILFLLTDNQTVTSLQDSNRNELSTVIEGKD
jgi:hypothetical protein